MEMMVSFLPLLTIAIGVGLPVLLLIQLFNKKSNLLKIPSLKIWKILIKVVGSPPKTKLNLFNFGFLLQLLLLCLLAYLATSPVILSENKIRPTFNILINRSTSMASKSENNLSRWERLKKTIYNQLIQKGLKSEDRIVVQFNPSLNSIPQEIALNQIDKVINEEKLVDLPPSEFPLFQMAKMKGQNIYVTDSVLEVPESLKEKFSILLIKDNEHINVGWIEFWVEDQTVNGVLKNYSNYSLNVNIDIKINGVSIQANDFEPAIKPNASFLFQKTIQEDFSKINLIEISVSCPGDSLESDNFISLSRLSTQKLKVLVTPEVLSAMVKAIRALSEQNLITIGELSNQSEKNQFDLLISSKYDSHLKLNQLIVNPTEGNLFFQVSTVKIDGFANSTQWLKTNEQKVLENVIFEQVKDLKENLAGAKLLTESKNGWPIIARWKHEKNSIYLLNFDCSDKTTFVQLPAFPFLVAKVLEEMNLNKFHYFKTGEVVESFSLSPNQPKVFQSNQKENGGRIDFTNSEMTLLTNSGIFSNENLNICVNLLNEKESNIKQDFIANQFNLNFSYQNTPTPIDLKPYIAGFIILFFFIEWMVYKKENY